jgi:hypothetical protein
MDSAQPMAPVVRKFTGSQSAPDGLVLILLIVLGATASRAETSRWNTVSRCIRDHLSVAEGAFATINGDDPDDLLKYCEWAMRERKVDFSDDIARSGWLFATKDSPGSQHKARVDRYFAPSK